MYKIKYRNEIHNVINAEVGLKLQIWYNIKKVFTGGG